MRISISMYNMDEFYMNWSRSGDSVVLYDMCSDWGMAVLSTYGMYDCYKVEALWSSIDPSMGVAYNVRLLPYWTWVLYDRY